PLSPDRLCQVLLASVKRVQVRGTTRPCDPIDIFNAFPGVTWPGKAKPVIYWAMTKVQRRFPRAALLSNRRMSFLAFLRRFQFGSLATKSPSAAFASELPRI